MGWVVFILAMTSVAGPSAEGPEQIHLVGGNTDDVMLVWISDVPWANATLWSAGEDHRSLQSDVDSYAQVQAPEGGENDCKGDLSYDIPSCYYQSGCIHQVMLSGLRPNTGYYYQVEQRPASSFKTPPAIGSAITFGVVGNLGQTRMSQRTVDALRGQKGIDLLLFPGDLSYADGYGPRWDSFGRLAEPLFSSTITSFGVGDHEISHGQEQSTPFLLRFPTHHLKRRSRSPDPLYYSYTAGLAHVVVLNSYAAYDEASLQYQWLAKDLAHYGLFRQDAPWLLVMLHVPWYTSSKRYASDAAAMKQALEPLLLKYRADFVLSGHINGYERTKPTTLGTVDLQCGITYITIGSGGNREELIDDWMPSDWSAHRESLVGFGRLELTTNLARWMWYRCDSGSHGDPTDKVVVPRRGEGVACGTADYGTSKPGSWQRSVA